MATVMPTLLTAPEYQQVVKAPSLAAAYDQIRKLPRPVRVQIGRKVFVSAEAFAKYVAAGGDQ